MLLCKPQTTLGKRRRKCSNGYVLEENNGVVTTSLTRTGKIEKYVILSNV